MKREETDVLIVGLGPVGAALAVYLGSSGVSTIAIERDTGVYPLPRAAHLDHETMRLLHLAGGAEAVAKASQPLSAYEFRNGAGELLMGFRPEGDLAPTGWPTSSMFHQPTLEDALRARLAKIPCVSVRLGHALSTYEENGGGIVATVAGPDVAHEIAARLIVGCDGGNSVVRRVAGIALDDLGFDEPWLVIDTRLKNGVERLSTIGLQHCDPARPVTSMPMSPGRHRWEFMLMPGETAEDVMSDARLAAMLAPFADPASLDIERRAVYRFHALIARQWRKGHTLLAGDAAHQMPPFMGQGLCSGTRDAANLAWKIEAVLRGRANESLLDSYQAEREPHVRMITEMAVAMGKVVCTQDAEAARLRDENMLATPEAARRSAMPGLDGLKSGVLPGGGAVFPEPWLPTGARLDDLVRYAPILIVRDECEASAAFGDRGGFVARAGFFADSHGDLAALMGDAAAVLVRPDRHVFGVGATATLVAAWNAYLASGVAKAEAIAAA
ncbi:MAG: bifunctional 3-(3-hydroxy-phenyl)propionate/3-hydroxycinnamic acid hydroxylase [Parvibaculum sp.]|uniref:bifunctional 3-(3-hydroxy-phenyl)propionate/3-hydroxycinnamic acid hydroxylase n=1 Tax=Parvibaculum sp. TaxID=2024848 RepID=UPI00271F99C5|nr:bifunctional 3-(3-hydroxy-phenyl)propionate/3-hydroxycinnamic acid hydroxylase [Parvibaculum sp.]MDO8837826.1 bifunctional 3-(3-hydroxy-phenyl)propionate/3-hydroxycinnamic acid hydroxylase [Parvibaculum sp.]